MDKLTYRESQILTLLCTECRDRKAVALRLGISWQTVKNHLLAIHRSTGRTTEQLCYELGRESMIIHIPWKRPSEMDPHPEER